MLIAHISDIQIRALKRHWEFKKSFEHLYASLEEKKPDAIVLAGDIAHNKLTISPELVQMLARFFKRLADIAPLIITPGNHDANLANLSRLDVLTPIVEALDHPSIHYYKNSEVVPWGDVNFWVYSCLDKEENYPTPKDVEHPDRINIGIFHGMINGATLQNGVRVEDSNYNLGYFLKNVDYLMLGDIHKAQVVGKGERAAYCGSYPQQNYGEGLQKGYCLWDIRSKEEHNLEFVRLPNVCPFYTIELDETLEVPEDLDLQRESRIRIYSPVLSIFDKKKIDDKLRKLYSPLEIKWKDEINAHRQTLNIERLDAKIENLREEIVQERLIKEFLKPYELDQDTMRAVLELNKRGNAQIDQEEDIIRNIQYRILKIRWNNLFSFREDNEVNFAEKPGILGIFGKNATGKSSTAVDIPLYTIFNKISKNVVKNDLLINENKVEEGCSSDARIQVGNDIYTIDRSTKVYTKSGKRKGVPVTQGRTNVDFTIYREDGSEELLNGEERNVTDKSIRQIFGTAEDFMSTSVAPQFQLLNFIDNRATERKKLIGRYFDVDAFERKHAFINEEQKAIKAKLKKYKDRSFEFQLNEETKKLEDISFQFKAKKEDIKAQEKDLELVSGDIEGLQKKIIQVEIDSSLTAKTLENNITKEKVTCISEKNNIDNIERNLRVAEFNSTKLSKEIQNFDEKSVKADMKVIEKNLVHIESNNQTIEVYSKKLKDLEKYTCLTNDDCCMKEDRDKSQKTIKLAKTECNEARKKVEELENYNVLVRSLVNYEEAKTQIRISQSDEKSLREKIESRKDILIHLSEKVQALMTVQFDFAKSREQLELNKNLESKIELLQLKKTQISSSVRDLTQSVLELSGEIGSTTAVIKSLEVEYEEFQELKKEYDINDYFMKAMSKNGISHNIIVDNLGVINREMRKILSHGVEFEIALETDETGKEINIYFKHLGSKRRHIELCSGMEKTIAAIVIRAALISVTTLPRSNVFVLDEVFAALDDEYLDAIANILQYLKNLFETVVIITHITSFKEICDHVIQIERDENGYSRIINQTV